MKGSHSAPTTPAAPVKNRASAGFTLTELAIAMVIIGILGVMFMREYVQYIEKVKISDTDYALDRIDGALQRYAVLNNGYPIPARLDRQDGDVDYGAQGTDSTAPENCASATWLANDGYCITTNPVANPVLIGAVPFQELQLTADEAMDYWNRKILYAVSVNQTSDSGFFNDDDNGDGTTGDDGSITVTAYDETLPWGTVKIANSNYDFVLVSGGETGLGFFRANGTQNGACPSGTPTVEEENCDFDDVFLLEDNKTLTPNRTETGGFYGTASVANNAAFYDDLVLATPSLTKETWYRATLDPNYALSPANRIGIGTETPQARLHVSGNVKADNVYSDNICDENSVCFNPVIIDGDEASMDCEGSAIVPGEDPAVVELMNSEVNCAVSGDSGGNPVTGSNDIVIETGGFFETKDCTTVGTGQLLQGIDAAGLLNCQDPP